MTRVQIKNVQNRDALVQTAAERLVVSAVEAMRTHGRFHVALSGGRTPKSLYAFLASDRYAARVDWSRVHVFWGDERCVPPADPMSNYRMAHETLIDQVPLPAENVHRLRGEDKIRLLTAVKQVWGERLTTVFARQGQYAHAADVASYLAADVTIERIGELTEYDLPASIGAARERKES